MPESPSNAALFHVPWEEFFSHATLPMGVLSRNGDDARFLKANAASAAQLGLAPPEMAGRTALELGIPGPLVEGWLMALDMVHQLRAPLDVPWQLSTPFGLRSFKSRVLPFPDRGGSTQHFGYINTDLTGENTTHLGDQIERERLAGALASALAEEIEAPLEQLLQLIGIVTDEVGALAATDPELELEECGRVLALATILARKAHLPVRELREFLRPQGFSPGPVDAAESVRSALRLVGSEVKRSVGLRVDTLPASLVQADEPRLRHALIGVLLETARGPGPAFARVGDLVVSMQKDDRMLELLITRTDRCPVPQGDLARCEILVREAGGSLRVEPWVSGGFRVRVTLPLMQPGA
ncbi:MAG TPA: hypothetical protein VMH40_17835 [Myxococcaceae bacterium]|nr:hypothetical protein [Myxococcaceae bacterium]